MPKDSTTTELSPGYDSMLQYYKDSIEAMSRQMGYGTYHPIYEEPPKNEEAPILSMVFFALFVLVLSTAITYISYTIIKKKHTLWYWLGWEDGEEQNHNTYLQTAAPMLPGVLIYQGTELNFSSETLHQVLQKYSPFFRGLNSVDQTKFINRVNEFIRTKNFHIHDESGFREMPILISGSAIQISFGLQDYLLPHFSNIHVFPDAFLSTEPYIRFLQGNVSGNNIHLSWNHFLQGFEFPSDGQNVGLHEMAHAYYFQYFETGKQCNLGFIDQFTEVDYHGNEVLQKEKLNGYDLYTDYGISSFQEFWAETVELFFEKPFALKFSYPELYESVCGLLNQYPA